MVARGLLVLAAQLPTSAYLLPHVPPSHIQTLLSARTTTISEAVTAIRGALQSSLATRRSRLAIELPPGTDLGLKGEKPITDATTSETRIRTGDRSLARIILDMIPSDYQTCVLFADPKAACQRTNLW